MATLTLEDGTRITSFDEVAAAVAEVGITLSSWPLGDDAEILELLSQPSLTDDEKERVLTHLDHYFAPLREAGGCSARDLVVLHPGIPNLDDLVATYARCHTHDDDEIRYIIDGDGVFGVVLPDGSQVELAVETAEYISVPTGLEHWFRMSEGRRIKAVRYFSEAAGWEATFTDTPIRF